MQGWIFANLVCIGSLFSLTGLRQFFMQPLEGTATNIVWFAIQVLPLLAVLPGIMRMNPTSLLFGILVAMLYLVHGVMLAATEPLRVMGVIEVVFALAMSGICTLILRRRRGL